MFEMELDYFLLFITRYFFSIQKKIEHYTYMNDIVRLCFVLLTRDVNSYK